MCASKSDLLCEHCAIEFETWSALQVHRAEVEGREVGNPFPDDLRARFVVVVGFQGRCQGTSGPDRVLWHMGFEKGVYDCEHTATHSLLKPTVLD